MRYYLDTINNYALLVCAGAINLNQLKEYSKKSKFIVGVDKGLDYLLEISSNIDLLVGDFDSSKKFYSIKGVEFLKFPSEKDMTDLEIAISEVIKRGYNNIYILGGLGIRMDHSLANVDMLSKYIGIANIYLLDSYNRIRVISESTKINRGYKYFSIIPFTEKLIKLNIRGAKYNLYDFEMIKGSSLGISNEVEKDFANISIQEGVAIVIESNDNYVY